MDDKRMKPKNNRGMTLLELMMAVAILTVVMGALFGISLSMTDTQQVQESKAVANDEARRALQQIIPDLRQAARSSINWADLPGQVVTYRVATDLNGNGVAVDAGGNIELSPERTIQRDVDDLTGDGFTETQLVLITGDTPRVIANNISPWNEQPDANGVFGPAQDLNGNGRLDRGFWVEPRDGGLEVSVQADVRTRRGHIMSATLTEFVVPRN
jgi:prepilin-type N-terminal cleavage/methylation domain-containing protein